MSDLTGMPSGLASPFAQFSRGCTPFAGSLAGTGALTSSTDGPALPPIVGAPAWLFGGNAAPTGRSFPPASNQPAVTSPATSGSAARPRVAAPRAHPPVALGVRGGGFSAVVTSVRLEELTSA